MYLSKLLLNPRSRQVQAELANPYEMHRTLMKAFPDHIKDLDRVLYRLELRRSQPQVSILVQSELQPTWSILEQRDYLEQPVEVKSYTPQIAVDQVYTFRLTANPTKRLPSDTDKDGKRVGLYKQEEQEAWLGRKAGQHGFLVLSVQIIKLDEICPIKHEAGFPPIRMSHHAITFDGILRVVDADLFTKAVIGGVGSAKGFGFGLLSIARIS